MLKADDLQEGYSRIFFPFFKCLHYFQILYSKHVLLVTKGVGRKIIGKNPLNLCLFFKAFIIYFEAGCAHSGEAGQRQWERENVKLTPY